MAAAKTKVIKIDPISPKESDIEFAASLLRGGALVCFPTETVYGIGANFMDETAVKKLYEIKKRSLNKPFTIHISSLDTIGRMRCEISKQAQKLIDSFWPGPLTIILKSKEGKLGFRMPQNRVAKSLISKSGVPVAAPSANLSGEEPPKDAGEISKDLRDKVDLILDGGRTRFQRESTIIDLSAKAYKILRKGAIPETEIEKILNQES
ncbi:MAG: threonylcarbamoyl-AMP synthase [Candidatus Omnitrophica bacterium]|nr:threonylcarbamoyl-AMP synthase [Candidatus Omnitrophota bacterium]